jgi:deoxycytidylate deaminase
VKSGQDQATRGTEDAPNGTTAAVESELRPDLYIGLVGAAGTDLTIVLDELRAQLSIVKYDVEHIKVSDLIREVLEVPVAADEYTRMKTLMAAGDALRKNSKKGDGVAALVISKIRSIRGDTSLRGNAAFVIDSLKNPNEVELLDRVYGRNFYTVSVYLSREERLRNIKNKIARGRREPPGKLHETYARELILDDEKGIGDHSQNVRDTFPKADYFLNSREGLGDQIKRFVELVFGEPFTTPTRDEYLMFLAKAAAYRSNDLSRQVGAVIADVSGHVAASGCNEVPYPGGGIFYEGREGGPGDNRDFTKQIDPNYTEIQRSLIELVGVLKQAGYVEDDSPDSQIVDALMQGHHKELVSNTRIRNLIEFGRIVHAEMNSICEAAAAGRSIRGGSLFCTTFPCHVCARHIIASGLREVVYIEPYPKSMTGQLYGDEIRFAHEAAADEGHDRIDHVTFRPFHGTSPTLFQRVFRYRVRKDRYGTIATWVPTMAIPQGAAHAVERPLLEANAALSLAGILDAAKVAFNEATEGGDGA